MFKRGSNIPSFATEPPCCPLVGCLMDSDLCAKGCNGVHIGLNILRIMHACGSKQHHRCRGNLGSTEAKIA
eukprot:5395099-Ditylum_brightwellii.AAC.1